MDLRRLVLLSTVFVLSVLGASQAMAQALVTVNGRVDAGTCSLDDVIVDMPVVRANTFPSSGTGGSDDSSTDVKLVLKACAGVTGADLTFGTSGDAAPTPSQTTFKNTAASPAPHTSVWLKWGGCTGGGSTVAPGNTRPVTISGASHDVDVCFRYHKLGTGLVTAGNIATSFVVSVAYR